VPQLAMAAFVGLQLKAPLPLNCSCCPFCLGFGVIAYFLGTLNIFFHNQSILKIKIHAQKRTLFLSIFVDKYLKLCYNFTMSGPHETITVTPNIIVDTSLGESIAKLDLTPSSLDRVLQLLEFAPSEVGETTVHFSADQTATPNEYRFGDYRRSSKTITLYPLICVQVLDDLAQHLITHEPKSDLSGYIKSNSSEWTSFRDACVSQDLSKALLHELKHRHDHAKNFATDDGHELFNQEMWHRLFTLLCASAAWSAGVASTMLLPNRWQAASAAVAVTDLTVQGAKALFSHFKYDRYHRGPLEIRARDFEETYAADYADLIIAELRA
jgi:hypothetical protein